MATIDFSRASGRSVTAGDRFHGLVANTLGVFVTWNDARKTRAALSALSNHELDDLGLCRGDIDKIAGKTHF